MVLIGFSVMLLNLAIMLMLSIGLETRALRPLTTAPWSCRRWRYVSQLVISTLIGFGLFALLALPSIADEGKTASIRALQIPNEFRGNLSLEGYVDASTREAYDISFEEMFHHQEEKFHPISGHGLNLGFVKASGWLRFAIERSPNAIEQREQAILLSLLPNMTNFIDVFVAVDKPGLAPKDFMKFEMGAYAPLLKSSFNGLDNVLRLQLPARGKLVVYIRAANIDSSLNLSATIYAPEGYGKRILNANLVVGLWIGGMLILIAVQLVFFFLDRRSLYGLLALHIAFTALAYFGGLGLSRLLLFPSGGAGNDLFVGSSNWLGLATGTLCIAKILELRERYPRLARLYQLGAVAGLVGVALVLTGHNRWFTPVSGPLILFVTTTALGVTMIDFWRLRHAEATLKLAAFALLWAGILLTNSQRYGVLPLPNWVSKSYGATSMIYFILITGSLAIRLRMAEETSRQADRKAIEAASAAEALAKRRVAERTLELEEAKRTAEAALQAELEAQKMQVRFMDVISHQYRTPLAVVRSNLESVRFTLPQDDAANRERLDRAQQAIRRLVEVIEINRARSILQGSSFEPTMARLPLGTVIDHAEARIKDLFPTALIDRHDGDLLDTEISADCEMLSLALVNLLENSLKFSPADTPLVTISLTADEDLVVVEIRDYGIGIPKDELDHVVTLGGRGSNASHLEGTGTGLSLVARIVAAHHGRFEISNALDGGTIARICLPV
jgi:signal transduction histidine kinase